MCLALDKFITKKLKKKIGKVEVYKVLERYRGKLKSPFGYLYEDIDWKPGIIKSDRDDVALTVFENNNYCVMKGIHTFVDSKSASRYIKSCVVSKKLIFVKVIADWKDFVAGNKKQLVFTKVRLYKIDYNVTIQSLR